MNIQEFRIKYPNYSKVSDEEITRKMNAKSPGFITEFTPHHPELRPGKLPVEVGKYDPRRVLGKYAYQPPLTASEIGRAGAKHFFLTELPESEMRERVNVALPRNESMVEFRAKYPEYDGIDDISVMRKVSAKIPRYKKTLNKLLSDQETLYKKIDLIEHKKMLKAQLTPEESMINLLSIPEDKKAIGQQAIIGYTNAASFGVSENILNHMGYKEAEPATGGEAVARGVGTLGGFISGPIEGASKTIRLIPGMNKIFQPVKATYKAKPYLVGLLRSGINLGTAQSMMMPPEAYKEGMVQPEQRIAQFGSGFVTGAMYGAVSYIPSKTQRMISASLLVGVPSTLREDSLEEQVFNYGFGAYMGIHGAQEAMKDEAKVRLWIDKGVQDKKGQEQLFKEGRRLLREFDTLAKSEGELYINPLEVGKGRESNFRAMNKDTKIFITKAVKKRLSQLKSEKGFELRNDKISHIFEALKGKKIEHLPIHQLYNLVHHVQPENTPPAPTTPFQARPAVKAGYKGKHLTLYQHLLRLGYSSMEHMGYGGMFEEGLTGNVVKCDVKDAQVKLLHRQLSGVWKRLAGTNKETSRRLALFRDGQLDMKRLVKKHPEYAKELRVGLQIEKYWKSWLDVQNRHRARYGMEPIKAVDNYYTHVFDATTKEAHMKKYPYPDTLADMQEFIIPKEGKQPFLKTRTGAKGYKMDIWGATDAYSFWGANYITDDGLRQAKRASNFMGKEMQINDKTGKKSPIDWVGLKSNTDHWIRRYSGQPGKFDIFIKDSIKHLPPAWQNKIGSVEGVSGMWRTLLYAGAMGWRPKLALRNLGQNTLILGMEKPRELWSAMRTRKSPQAKQILKNSLVLQTRELGFAPELPYSTGVGKMETARRSAFHMFRAADRINVEHAFLSGYYGARRRGLNHQQAIKRGDSVAAQTQFMYTKGNRGPISDLWGLSATGGKMASMFTTWPINKIEYDLMIAKPENRAGLLRYVTTVGILGLAGLASNSKIKTTAYTGWGAEAGIFKKINDGLLDFKFIMKPRLQIWEDVKRAVKDEDLLKIFMYDTERNLPFWENF